MNNKKGNPAAAARDCPSRFNRVYANIQGNSALRLLSNARISSACTSVRPIRKAAKNPRDDSIAGSYRNTTVLPPFRKIRRSK